MGNSPLTVCVHGALEQHTVQVVQPDGQVIFMSPPVMVSDLQLAYPEHFVCHGAPSLVEQRLPEETKLEIGEIYYLLPMPRAYVPRPAFQRRGHRSSPRVHRIYQESSIDSPAFDTQSPKMIDYTQLRMKPHQSLIRFFIFRQCFTSVLPEESFNKQGRESAARSSPHKYSKLDSRYMSRGYRHLGRRPIITWRPQLESISEVKAVNNYSKKIATFKITDTFLPMRFSPVERDLCVKQRLVYSA